MPERMRAEGQEVCKQCQTECKTCQKKCQKECLNMCQKLSKVSRQETPNIKWSEINSKHTLVKHYACGNYSCQTKSSWGTSELRNFNFTTSHHITHISHSSHRISPHHSHLTSPISHISHHICTSAHHTHLQSHLTTSVTTQ